MDERTVSGMLAASRARGMIGANYAQDLCLTFVYDCYGRPSTGLPGGSFDSAKEAISRLRVPLRLDWENAPEGAAHWWAGDPGHVAVGTGNGRAVSTNAFRRATGTTFEQGKRRNTATIGERSIAELTVGRGAYLGWTLEAFNNTIISAVVPGDEPAPAPTLGRTSDMPRIIANSKTGQLVFTDLVGEWHITKDAYECYDLMRGAGQIPFGLPMGATEKDAAAAIRKYLDETGATLSDAEFNRCRDRVKAVQSYRRYGQAPASSGPGGGATAAQVADELANRLKA